MGLLDQLTKEKGYLDGRYMAATFNLLRGRDLIWNYVVNNYLLGRGAAAVRPALLEQRHDQPAGRMAPRLSRDLYKGNKLAEKGGIAVAGTPIDIGSVKTPTYVQAGREDHIAPPQSVWKIMNHFAGPKRFVLAGSGHIAGVVNPPAAQKYQYWINDRAVRHARCVRRGRDRAQGQLVARLARMAEDAGSGDGEGGRRARSRQGQAQGDRGRAGELCQIALTAWRCGSPSREEREELEDLQRRASLELPEYREQLLDNPDAIHLPHAQIANGQVIVAELDGEIAGFAAVVGGELDGLFVEPELWGHGIGRALVDAATHEARRKGFSLSVTANPRARKFYESCGFSVEGEVQTRFGPGLRMTR